MRWQRKIQLNWAEKYKSGQLDVIMIIFISAHLSAEEAQRHHRCERWHAGDEGGEPADDEGEEGDHPGAVPLAPLPPAPTHRCYPAALPAAVWHQCCEFPGHSKNCHWDSEEKDTETKASLLLTGLVHNHMLFHAEATWEIEEDNLNVPTCQM